MDSLDYRLEFAHRFIEEIRFCKYIRDYFSPESYADTRYGEPEFNMEDVTECVEPDFLSDIIGIAFREEGVEYEEAPLGQFVETEEEDTEVQDLWDNGYYLSNTVRIKFLRELYDGDRELYEKAQQTLKIVTGGHYDSIVECYVGGNSQVDAFNKEACCDILFFGEHSADGHYEFFADFHRGLKEAHKIYNEEFVETIDDRLSFLLNISKEELWNESTY